MKRIGLILASLALTITPMRLPAQSCILSNIASEQTCAPASCANKVCCRDAKKNTASATQPLTTADAASQLIAPLPATVAHFLPRPHAAQQFLHISRTLGGHSPSRLALFCTFLI